MAARRPSDTEEVTMIASANVYAGWLIVRCPSPVPERHDARTADTGKEHRVTTQVTRQISGQMSPPIVWGYATRPPPSCTCLVAFRKISKKMAPDRATGRMKSACLCYRLIASPSNESE